jgi:hypothetical protein
MKRISLCIAATLPFLILPGGAAASDTKVLPGTVCQAEVGSTHKGDYTTGSYDYSRMTFPDGHRITCPIVREVTSGVLTEVRVRFRHTNLGSDTIQCHVSSQADDASGRDTTDPQSHTSSSAGGHEFVFTIDALDHFNGVTFAVQCTLNQGLAISSIRYTED